MNMHAIKILILTEVRLRMRRTSTLVTLFAVAALAWLMFADQSGGYTFIAIGNARVLNTSSTIAIGSVSLFGLIFGLAGFFLTRGRIGEDVRCGTGSVIGSSTISSSLFLMCRWLGGVGYLVLMASVFMLTVMVCHLFRGTGPIQPWVYIETYFIILFPLICFSVSCAVLFDSIAPLMGKLGDVVFFFLWVAQFTAMNSVDDHGPIQFCSLLLIDFSGTVMSVKSLLAQLHSNAISLGYASFDPQLPAITLSNDLWTSTMVLMRLTSAAIASLVLLPAFFIFHRYSTDKVKVSHTSQRRSPLEMANQFTRPLTRLIEPLYKLAAHFPGIWGAALADVALTLNSSPAAILVLLIVFFTSLVAKFTFLPVLLLVSTLAWGIIISDVSTRDYISGCEDMTGVVPGGVHQRYLRQFVATFILGMFLSCMIMLRFALHDAFLAAALLTGLVSLSALASLCGRLSRTPRLFLSIFLFWIYVAVQVPKVAIIDIVAFNGVANTASAFIQLGIATTALVLGYSYNRWIK